MRRLFLCAALLLVSTLATGPAFAAWPISSLTPVPVAPYPSNQYLPVLASDGSGGVFVAWSDDRSGAYDVYLSRVVNGATAPGWPAGGLAVCTATDSQDGLSLVAGSAGDVYVVWHDLRAGNDDVYAQRVLGNSTIAPGWPANGLALASTLKNESLPHACSDGAGGFYAVWTLEYTPGTDYDIYATHIVANGTIATGYVPNGLAVNGQLGRQQNPTIAADGAGNAVIAYENVDGSNNGLIWGQKIGPSSVSLWGTPGQGVQLSFYANNQRNAHVVTDDAGGALVGWDLFVGPDNEEGFSYLSPGGVSRGTAIAFLEAGANTVKRMVSDNHGGAWLQMQGGSGDQYAYHLDAGGRTSTSVGIALVASTGDGWVGIDSQPDGSVITATNPPNSSAPVVGQEYDSSQNAMWSGGVPVTLANDLGLKLEETVLSDGANGAFAAWITYHSPNYQVYCTHVDRFGALGDASPAIVSMGDVPHDQGGFVALQWTASYMDASPDFRIANYSLWRRVASAPAAALAGARATVLGPREARPTGTGRVLRAEPDGANVVYWEYLSQTPARGYPGYSAVVATVTDSIGGSNPLTNLRVEAETASGIPYWDSAPDSGYSVDNLPPVTPAPFTAQYAAGTTHLHWNPNTERDLAGYRLYRGSSLSFVPSSLNLIASPADTGYADVANAPYIYKLTAIDIHGNESPPAVVAPTGTTGVGGELPPALAFAPPAPNPARGGTALRFALPQAAHVRLAILDAAGRERRVLASGDLGAGDHASLWDLRDNEGHTAAAGLYFARLQVGSQTLVRRLVIAP